MGFSGRRVRRGLSRTSLTAAVVLVSTLAGCSRAEPGVVAYVGDTRITQRQLDDAVAGVSSTLEAGQEVSREAVINVMIQGAMAERIAADNKIVITDSQRNTVIRSSNLAALLDVPRALPVAYDVADQQLVGQKLGSQAYLAAIAKQSVKLNPRFGVLDPSQKTIVVDQSGSLAKPGTPTPTPPG
jgi:hypothetical protein